MTVRPLHDAKTAPRLHAGGVRRVAGRDGAGRWWPTPDDATRELIAQHGARDPRSSRSSCSRPSSSSETSTEELKASNEELQAINEELRSATEELETSKEELQSMNEELITVNHELKIKVEETRQGQRRPAEPRSAPSRSPPSSSTASMRIKRFTPQAQQAVQPDRQPTSGRSLLDITHRLDYDELDERRDARLRDAARGRARGAQPRRPPLPGALPAVSHRPRDRIERRGADLRRRDRRCARPRSRCARARSGCAWPRRPPRDFAIMTLDAAGHHHGLERGRRARCSATTEDEVIGQPGAIIFTPEDRAARRARGRDARARASTAAPRTSAGTCARTAAAFYCSGVMTPIGRRRPASGFAKIARDVTGTQAAVGWRAKRCWRRSSRPARRRRPPTA